MKLSPAEDPKILKATKTSTPSTASHDELLLFVVRRQKICFGQLLQIIPAVSCREARQGYPSGVGRLPLFHQPRATICERPVKCLRCSSGHRGGRKCLMPVPNVMTRRAAFVVDSRE
jgi:hypothetical protein